MKRVLLSLAVCIGLTFITAANAQEQKLIQKIDTSFTQVTSLKIQASFAQVIIANSTSNKLSLSGSLYANESVGGFTLSQALANGVLTITINYPSNNWVTHSGELKFSVPKNVTVDIENTSGYIKLDNVTDLTLNALTTSGKMFINNCTGDYALRSTTGDITLNNTNGNYSITSSSGKILINGSKGKLNITNLSGETSVSKHEGDLDIESTSGKITIESISGKIYTKGASAPIKISKVVGDVTVKSFSGDVNLFDIKGVLQTDTGAGDQIGAQITLTGSSKFVSTEGSIKMRLINPTTDLTFKCLSESGFIQARTQSKKKKLFTGKGAIVIESISTTGGQIFN